MKVHSSRLQTRNLQNKTNPRAKRASLNSKREKDHRKRVHARFSLVIHRKPSRNLPRKARSTQVRPHLVIGPGIIVDHLLETQILLGKRIIREEMKETTIGHVIQGITAVTDTEALRGIVITTIAGITTGIMVEEGHIALGIPETKARIEARIEDPMPHTRVQEDRVFLHPDNLKTGHSAQNAKSPTKSIPFARCQEKGLKGL